MLIFIFVLIIYTNPKIWKFWVSYISHRRQGLVWNVTQTRESWRVAQIATFSIFLSFLPFLHQRFRAHGHKNGTSLCYSGARKWSAVARMPNRCGAVALERPALLFKNSHFFFLLDIVQLGLMVAEVINCPFPYFPIPYGCWYSTVPTRFYTIWPVLHLKSTMRLLK